MRKSCHVSLETKVTLVRKLKNYCSNWHLVFKDLFKNRDLQSLKTNCYTLFGTFNSEIWSGSLLRLKEQKETNVGTRMFKFCSRKWLKLPRIDVKNIDQKWIKNSLKNGSKLVQKFTKYCTEWSEIGQIASKLKRN